MKPVIDTIKKIIKNKKNDSPNKVLALKLLNDCLTEGKSNEELILYTEKKILKRLIIFAKTRKVTHQFHYYYSRFRSLVT